MGRISVSCKAERPDRFRRGAPCARLSRKGAHEARPYPQCKKVRCARQGDRTDFFVASAGAECWPVKLQPVSTSPHAFAVIDGTLCQLTPHGRRLRWHAPLATAVIEFRQGPLCFFVREHPHGLLPRPAQSLLSRRRVSPAMAGRVAESRRSLRGDPERRWGNAGRGVGLRRDGATRRPQRTAAAPHPCGGCGELRRLSARSSLA